MYKKVDIKTERLPLFQIHDIAYARTSHWFGFSEQNLMMDMIRPQKIEGLKRPVIVWLCGGSWQVVERAAHLSELTYFAERGYTVFSVTYRTSNDAIFPAPLEDVKSAIRYIRAHAGSFGIDGDRIAVMGESAGGHLAALTGLTGMEKNYDRGAYLEKSSAVQAVVDWYGPTDFTVLSVGGTEIQPQNALAGTNDLKKSVFREMSPVYHVTKDAPPFLILHGSEDKTVPCEQSRLLYRRLTETGVRADFIEIAGADHADIQFSQTETKREILNFLNEVMG